MTLTTFGMAKLNKFNNASGFYGHILDQTIEYIMQNMDDIPGTKLISLWSEQNVFKFGVFLFARIEFDGFGEEELSVEVPLMIDETCAIDKLIAAIRIRRGQLRR